jgi:hypothetical protein
MSDQQTHHTYILNAPFEDVVSFLHSCTTTHHVDFYNSHMHSHTFNRKVTFAFTTSYGLKHFQSLIKQHFPSLTNLLKEVDGAHLDW